MHQSPDRDHGPENNLPRNKAFRPKWKPLKFDAMLNLEPHHVSGPIGIFNPTVARFRHDARSDIHFKWTSRNNRKGRHAVVVNPTGTTSESKHTPRPTSSLRVVARNVWRMLTYYPFWDVSFDVAFVFTLGSVIWVINAFFAWLPLVRPDTAFKNESLYGGGITAFIGATVFEFGSFLLMAEAVNENRSGCFGWALERSLSHREEGQDLNLRPSKSRCTHHHLNKRNLVGKGRYDGSESQAKPETAQDGHSWVWWPSSEEFRSHYLHSLGFLASLSQLLGASIFWIAGLTSLPGIYDHMSRPLIIVFYWTPQVIGGTGFIISGTLFMLETQSKWWKPALTTLGWWVGAWNLIGGIGFTLCPAFGYDTDSWAQYQASLATFWGSWAFLIGSALQWYESLEKFPVEIDRRENTSESTLVTVDEK